VQLNVGDHLFRPSLAAVEEMQDNFQVFWHALTNETLTPLDCIKVSLSRLFISLTLYCMPTCSLITSEQLFTGPISEANEGHSTSGWKSSPGEMYQRISM